MSKTAPDTSWKSSELSAGIKSVSVDYTATVADTTILVDATALARTITLPPAANCKGLILNIKKTDSSVNGVTIDGNGAETIDGAATKSTTTQYAGWMIQSDGANWFIL